MEDIARFLHAHPPFSLLSFAQVTELTKSIQIEYFTENYDVLVQGGKLNEHLFIVRRGSVDLLRTHNGDTQTYDTVGEGDFFGHYALIHKQPPFYTARTREEALIYLLPARSFDDLRNQEPAFNIFFASSVIERLDHALRTHNEKPQPELFQVRLGDIMHRSLVTVPPNTNVRKAAQVMRQYNVSSVIVTSDPPGILTDRDLRNRVLASGLGETVQATEVMSSPVVALQVDSLVFEGVMLMTERNIHHIPITENNAIVGMVTHTDILHQQSRSPLLLPRQLERARSSSDLRAYTNQVEATVRSLLEAGARTHDIGRIVAVAHSALLRRLLRDTEGELGEPPCAYAWLVLGSEGRYEQTLRTDQDNALVYADDAPEEAAPYFEVLAERVIEGLIACGFPPCPGNFMATNPEWRQPLHVWQRSFESWIEHPDEESLLRAAIMFDFRQVYGELKAEVALRQIVERSSKQHVFLARLGRTALRQSPPLTFFRNFAVERSGDQRDLIDVKTRGTALIVDLARVYALEAGSSETNTLARLRAATTQSSLSPTTAEELSAAFDLISLLRLRHQYRMLREGKKPSNLVPVSSLSRLEQRDLKDAFRAISTSQRGLEQTFQISLFG